MESIKCEVCKLVGICKYFMPVVEEKEVIPEKKEIVLKVPEKEILPTLGEIPPGKKEIKRRRRVGSGGAGRAPGRTNLKASNMDDVKYALKKVSLYDRQGKLSENQQAAFDHILDTSNGRTSGMRDGQKEQLISVYRRVREQIEGGKEQ